MFREWSQWPEVKDKVGPPGSGAMMTPAAAENIWRRVALPSAGQIDDTALVLSGTVDVEGFLELAY